MTLIIAGAETFAVDLYGDGLIHFETGSPVTRKPAGVRALAENNGLIQADGGRVLITAAAAEGIVDQAIQVGGKVTTRNAYTDGGEIVLDGGNHGTVAVTGTLDASSSTGRGGKIDMRGHTIRLGRKSLVKASGSAGGGDIRIGGDLGGQGPGRNADRVILAPKAQVIADATGFGDGGSIIVYGKDTARIKGQLTARGGLHGGNGGFIETSAVETIDIASAQVDASAPAGEPGTWLIDPQDIITIGVAAADAYETTLEGGSNVAVTTIGAGTDAGNITVAASIQPDLATATGDQTVTLTLTADNDVTINSDITIGPTNADAGGSMGVSITAGGGITNNGTINTSLGGGAVNLTAASDIALGRIDAGAGNIGITATTGAITDNTAGEGPGNENIGGGAISLTAGGSIGGAAAGADIDTAVTSIDAQTTSGGIFIDETDAVTLGNSQTVSAGSGKIELTTRAGNLQVNAGVTADGNLSLDAAGLLETADGPALSVNDGGLLSAGGSVSLAARGGDIALGCIDAGSNAIAVNLDAAGLLHIAAAVSGSTVSLTGGTGITHTAAGDVTSGGTITATATTGDIAMADGTVYSAGGAVNLTAQGNVALGRVETDIDNTIVVTATEGAISDNMAGEGAGNENLVCCNIILNAASGIGAADEAADINVTAGGVDATTGSGGVYLAEIDTGQCGEPTVSDPTGPDTTGPDTTAPDPTVTDTIVPDPTGPDTTVPETADSDTGDTDIAGPDVTGPDALVSESPREDIPDRVTEPEKIPNDTIALHVLLFRKTNDSTLQLTPGVFDSLADAYAIPDYEADDELYMVHLSGANEALWEESGGHDDDGEEEE